MVLLRICLKDAVQQHISFHSTSVCHFTLLTTPFLMAECFNKQPWVHLWHLAVCCHCHCRCFAVRFPRGSVLLLCSQVCASVKSPLRCTFKRFVFCEQFCSFPVILVVLVCHKLFSCMSIFQAGLTSLNPVKSWIFKHPTHQRCWIPANFLAFSLWLWVFLSRHCCCMVKKIQEFICRFKRHKHKWKCLKISHLWTCVRMGHLNTVQASTSTSRVEAASLLLWMVLSECTMMFLLEYFLRKFQDLPDNTVLLILVSLSAVQHRLTFPTPHLVQTSAPWQLLTFSVAWDLQPFPGLVFYPPQSLNRAGQPYLTREGF